MQTDWASENLQIIRTLMERSAIYRRALAPLTVSIGVTGLVAAVIAHAINLKNPGAFVSFWLCVAVVCVLEAFFLVRRQALKDREPLWSSPTRRVTQALAPALCSGVAAGVPFLIFGANDEWPIVLLVPIWMVLYGCALHAAGFFMPRGIKLLGWAFIIIGWVATIAGLQAFKTEPSIVMWENWVMGICFGGGHLAYGIYLYFTEKRRETA